MNLYSAFVPSEKNPLIDILLSRSISGESPSKLATRSRSRSISPSKAKRHKKTSKPLESPLKVKDIRSNSNTEAQEGLLNRNAVAGECHRSRLASSVDHCAGPSTESSGKTVKVETMKKVGPTRKGKGKTKTNGMFLPNSLKSSLTSVDTLSQMTRSWKRKSPRQNLLRSVREGRRKPSLELVILACLSSSSYMHI